MKIRAKKVLSLALAAAVTFSTVLFGNGMVTKAADVTIGTTDKKTGEVKKIETRKVNC